MNTFNATDDNTHENGFINVNITLQPMKQIPANFLNKNQKWFVRHVHMVEPNNLFV